jgi:outer membrane biosynthesis protein TonB
MSAQNKPRARLSPLVRHGLLLALLCGACGPKPQTDPAAPPNPHAPADVQAPTTDAPPDAAPSPAPAAGAAQTPEVSQADPGDSGAFQLGAHHAKPIIEANRPYLNRTCWADAVKRNPSGPAKVKIAIEVEVQTDGSVSRVALVGGKDYEGFAGCVQNHVKHWRWPKAKAVSSLMFPIEFSRGEIEWKVKEPAGGK